MRWRQRGRSSHRVPFATQEFMPCRSLVGSRFRSASRIAIPRTASYLNQMLEKTNFFIAQVSPDIIRNRQPLQGEAAEFQEVPYSADRRLAPAIITLLPARPEGTRMLLLLGRNLTSLTSVLTSLEGLKLLDDQWKKSGSPDAWEMVIQAEIYRDTILKTTPVALRPIPATFWK